MKPATVVKARGTWRRSSPRRIAASSVVETRSTAAKAPRVPLARMFHAPQSPLSDKDRGPTSTRGPAATNGRRTAKARKGASRTRRRATTPRGTRPSDARPTSTARSATNAHQASRGVATTATTNSAVAATLHCGGRRWRAESASTCSEVAASPAPTGSAGPGVGRLVLRGLAQGPQQGEGADPEPEGDQDPDDAGHAGAEAVVVDATDLVVGDRAVGQVVLLLGLREALLVGHLGEPIRIGVGEGADEEGQGQRQEQPGDEEE